MAASDSWRFDMNINHLEGDLLGLTEWMMSPRKGLRVLLDQGIGEQSIVQCIFSPVLLSSIRMITLLPLAAIEKQLITWSWLSKKVYIIRSCRRWTENKCFTWHQPLYNSSDWVLAWPAHSSPPLLAHSQIKLIQALTENTYPTVIDRFSNGLFIPLGLPRTCRFVQSCYAFRFR